jgi:hypothetical protein
MNSTFSLNGFKVQAQVQVQECGLKNQTYLPAGRLKTQKQKQKVVQGSVPGSGFRVPGFPSTNQRINKSTLYKLKFKSKFKSTKWFRVPGSGFLTRTSKPPIIYWQVSNQPTCGGAHASTPSVNSTPLTNGVVIHFPAFKSTYQQINPFSHFPSRNQTIKKSTL